MKELSVWRRYSFGWVTLGFFLISIVGQWVFGWFAFVDEQQAHGEPVEFSTYFMELSRDTLENWQSEFLQLIWQVGGLAFLLWVGSRQSKDGDERLEAKVNALLRQVDPKNAEEIIREIDALYAGHYPDPEPIRG